MNIYKEGHQALVLPLVHLTNLVITKKAWPSQWKESVILPTLKSSKPPGILSSYRPVVNLCSVSKIVERVLYDQMVQHLDDSGVIPHEQHGFRSGRSTDTALATLFSRIAQAQDQSSQSLQQYRERYEKIMQEFRLCGVLIYQLVK